MNIKNHLLMLFSYETIRFVLTGGLNTLFGYIVYILAFWLSNNTVAALLLSYGLGILFNFNTYSRFVFRNQDHSKLLLFVLVYAFTLSINYISLFILIDQLRINPYLSQLLTLGYVPLILFVMMKRFVFQNDISTRHPAPTSSA